MGENTELPALKRGYFPLRIRVEDKEKEAAGKTAAIPASQALLQGFIERIEGKYQLQTLQAPTSKGEALIAVPFPDKEMVRVDFNIYASEAEAQDDTSLRFYFYMESAYESL